MIATVARKEFRGALRDGRVLAGALLLLVLGLAALASAAARYADVSAERAAAQALIQEQWTAQGEKNPHSAAHYGIYAFRAALPLGFFDPGVSSYEGVSIWLEAHKRNFAIGRPADDMTALARFGELSLAFVFQALVPLGLILMAYAAFSGEREGGTLRQLLASGVTPAQLFLGKFAGLGGAALLLLAPLLAVCLVALVYASGATWLPAAGVLLLVYGLYGALVLLLSLTVSARASSSQGALLVLLAFWAVVTFVVPRIAADLGRSLEPTPTAGDFQRGVDSDLATGLDGESPAAKVEKRRQQLLKLYKVEREQDLPINFQGIVFGIQDDVGNAVYDKHFGILERAIDRQVDVFEAASVLSPRMALSLVSQEVAGTSLQHQRWFERGAEQFRRKLMDILNRDIAINSRTGQADYRAGAALWRRTGEYRYEPEPLAASLARCAAPLTVLALWLAILVGASVVTTRHLRVLAA
jgi:ABC-2 type transport system permease protein